MATIANFNIDQGSSFTTTVDISTSASGDFQLNTYSARGKIRKSRASASYVSFSCAINENSPIQDNITISLTSAQTKSMKPGRYLYDIEIFTTAGSVIRVLEGQVEVLASMTQANPLGEGIEFKYTEENFTPHVMFHPNDGTSVNVLSYADHVSLMAQDYTHVYPIGADNPLFDITIANDGQSVMDTIDSSFSQIAADTTNNSPGDSGGETSSYY